MDPLEGSIVELNDALSAPAPREAKPGVTTRHNDGDYVPKRIRHGEAQPIFPNGKIDGEAAPRKAKCTEREDGLRDCLCADPEHCTQEVPGYLCRKGMAQPTPPACRRHMATDNSGLCPNCDEVVVDRHVDGTDRQCDCGHYESQHYPAGPCGYPNCSCQELSQPTPPAGEFERLVDTSATHPRVDGAGVARALGAEPVGPPAGDGERADDLLSAVLAWMAAEDEWQRERVKADRGYVPLDKPLAAEAHLRSVARALVAAPSPTRSARLDEIARLVADDQWAASFQTLGGYRKALLEYLADVRRALDAARGEK